MLVIIFFVLMTFKFDLRVILKGEIRSQSLIRVRELTCFMYACCM